MLHLVTQPQAQESPLAYAEAVSRLASVRHALRLVEPFGGGPASDLPEDVDIAAAWVVAGDARQDLFDRRSCRLVCATAAGIGALASERQEGRTPAREAGQALIDEIRRELRDVARIVLD